MAFGTSPPVKAAFAVFNIPFVIAAICPSDILLICSSSQSSLRLGSKYPLTASVVTYALVTAPAIIAGVTSCPDSVAAREVSITFLAA